MSLVGVAVDAAVAGGNGGEEEYGRTLREGWSCAFRQSIPNNDCASRICVVCWTPIPAQCACVGVIHLTTMSMAVVPILPMLVRSGRMRGLLRAGTVAAKPGGLLWEITTTIVTAGTAIAVATAVASVAAIVECGLLLRRGVDVGWGLLADSHA